MITRVLCQDIIQLVFVIIVKIKHTTTVSTTAERGTPAHVLNQDIVELVYVIIVKIKETSSTAERTHAARTASRACACEGALPFHLGIEVPIGFEMNEAVTILGIQEKICLITIDFLNLFCENVFT